MNSCSSRKPSCLRVQWRSLPMSLMEINPALYMILMCLDTAGLLMSKFSASALTVMLFLGNSVIIFRRLGSAITWKTSNAGLVIDNGVREFNHFISDPGPAIIVHNHIFQCAEAVVKQAQFSACIFWNQGPGDG